MSDIKIQFDESPNKGNKKRIFLFVGLLIILVVVGLLSYFVIRKYISLPKKATTSSIKENLFHLKDFYIGKNLPKKVFLRKAISLINSGLYGKAKDVLKKGLSLSPDNETKALIFMYLGIIAGKEGEFREAEKYLKMALSYDKNNPFIYKNLAFLYKQMKKYDEAIKYLEWFYKKSGSKMESDRILLAKMYLENQNSDKAIKVLSALLDEDKDNVEAHLLLGKAYRMAMNIRKAIFHYKKVVELGDGIYKAMALKRLGDIYAEMKDYKQAIFFYSKALDISPDDLNVLYGISKVYILSGKGKKAIPYLKEAFSLAYNKDFLVLIGDSAFSVGAIDLALSSYKKAFSLDKHDRLLCMKIAKIYEKKDFLDNAIRYYELALKETEGSLAKREIIIKLANLYKKKGDFTKAIRLYKEALKIEEDEEAYIQLANVYMEIGKDEEALRLLYDVVSKHKEYSKAGVMLANIYMKKGFYDSAESVLIDVLDRKPKDARANYFLSELYLKEGNYKKAVDGFLEVISSDNNEEYLYKALSGLGYSYFKLGDYENALKYAKKAISYAPDKGDGYFVLGKIYIKLGDYGKAIEVLKKAFLLFSDDKKKSEVDTFLGISYFRLGEYTKAMQFFNEALTLNPENETARINLDITRKAIKEEIVR